MFGVRLKLELKTNIQHRTPNIERRIQEEPKRGSGRIPDAARPARTPVANRKFNDVPAARAGCAMRGGQMVLRRSRGIGV
jgi:hypothetical protein